MANLFVILYEVFLQFFFNFGNRCQNGAFDCPNFLSNRPTHNFAGAVAIANRAGGSFSLVDPISLATVIEQDLPDGGEPMYFAFASSKNEIWIGDRANNRLVIYRMVGCGLVYDGFVETRAGLFHSMITQRFTDPYPIVITTCDIDNVITVHDLTTRRLLAVIERPTEAVQAGAKPHDCTINGEYIFVTFLGSQDGSGYVASYDANTFALIAVFETEADPHVAIRDDSLLFTAAQGGSNPGFVITVSVPDLTEVNRVQLPSPHGMFLSYSLTNLYITNISGGGAMAVEVFDAATGNLKNCPEVTTSFAVPHNPVISFDEQYIYITHSGAMSNMNTRFNIGADGCLDPASEVAFQTDLNPFGTFILPDANNLLQCANEL